MVCIKTRLADRRAPGPITERCSEVAPRVARVTSENHHRVFARAKPAVGFTGRTGTCAEVLVREPPHLRRARPGRLFGRLGPAFEYAAAWTCLLDEDEPWLEARSTPSSTGTTWTEACAPDGGRPRRPSTTRRRNASAATPASWVLTLRASAGTATAPGTCA